MEKLKILIVDDEVLIAEDLKDIIKSFGCKNIFLAHSKTDAIESLENHKPNLALLDIRMEKELDGLELGDYINLNYKIPFIYITAHSDMAMIKEIIKTKPIAYITKPFKKTDLFAGLNMANSKIRESENKVLQIKDGYNTIIIPFDMILYIEGEGNYINIFYGTKKIVSRQSMDSVIEELDPEQFFKIHRSYIININKTTKYSKKEVVINNVALPVSRNTSETFEIIMKKAGK